MGAVVLVLALGGLSALLAAAKAARAAYHSTLSPAAERHSRADAAQLPQASIWDGPASVQRLAWIAGGFAGLTAFATTSFATGLLYAVLFEPG